MTMKYYILIIMEVVIQIVVQLDMIENPGRHFFVDVETNIAQKNFINHPIQDDVNDSSQLLQSDH